MTLAGHLRPYWTLFSTLLLLGLLLALAGCGGDEETTTSAAPTTAAPTTTAAMPPAPTDSSAPDGGATTTGASVTLSGEEADIAANWTKFFDGSLPVTDKAALLEDGDQYTEELETQAASPLAQAATAAVSAVTITSPTTAQVTYSLLLSGQMALPDQKGQAVKQGEVWKVSAETFLALAALQGGALPTS
jgi:hypothetical protein